MRLSLKHSTSLASVLFFVACSSVPDEAPEEFHLADASIEEAKDADVDEVLPQTVERAEATLDEALDLYDKSEDGDLDRSARDNIMKEAATKAGQAKVLADQAKALDNQVKAWDNKIEEHQGYAQLNQELQNMREQLAAARQQTHDTQLSAAQTQQQSQEAGSASKLNIKGPVAFFDSGETQVKGRFTESLGGLADVLKSDPRTQVRLMGYTDPKGNGERNRELARQRAESVGRILQSMGVPQNQILIDPAGVDSSIRPKHAGDLQLARRVEASIVSGEGATGVSSR